MKRYVTLAIMLLLAAQAMCQQPKRQPHEKKRADISELVDDLSAQQKRKVDAIGRESRERVEALRTQKHAVRDSIERYMDLDGDQSRVLHPLFDREAALQAAISREMYDAKRRIDEVLTPAQRAKLRTACRPEAQQPKPRRNRQ